GRSSESSEAVDRAHGNDRPGAGRARTGVTVGTRRAHGRHPAGARKMPRQRFPGAPTVGRMTSRSAIDVRPITEPEFSDWNRALNTGFLREPTSSDDVLEARRLQFRPGRSLGAFDDGRCVATLRSFPQELTAVGGAAVPADAVSNVTVTATHRRRGLLSRMMAQDLAAAKER